MTTAVKYVVATGEITSRFSGPEDTLAFFCGPGEDYIVVVGDESPSTHYVEDPGTSAATITLKTAFAITQDKTEIDDDGVDTVTWGNVPAGTKVRGLGGEYTTASSPAFDTVEASILYAGGYPVDFFHVKYLTTTKYISCKEVSPWA
jgi:hypothetical protein